MNKLEITEYHGIRVLTSAQVAQMYGTDSKTISYNFTYNKQKYEEGKHYVKLKGAELKEFKASREIPDCHKFSAHLYLWTEKGALLHAKSLNTDKAWQAYDYLVDFYFRAKEQKPEAPKPVLQKEKPKEVSVDREIAPDFRRIIQALPVETLDEMEKAFRGNHSMALKLAETSILAEKMKRILAEDCI